MTTWSIVFDIKKLESQEQKPNKERISHEFSTPPRKANAESETPARHEVRPAQRADFPIPDGMSQPRIRPHARSLARGDGGEMAGLRADADWPGPGLVHDAAGGGHRCAPGHRSRNLHRL